MADVKFVTRSQTQNLSNNREVMDDLIKKKIIIEYCMYKKQNKLSLFFSHGMFVLIVYNFLMAKPSIDF